ncbi:MAG: DUF151 domain-containing protein [Desulfurococcales archaeon]|nr:DUF151 domain-containing protein [Desulfurococcales archaeon]
MHPFEEIIEDYRTGIGAVLIGLRLYLEEGKMLTLVNIPPEIALTIQRLNRGDLPPERQSIYDILAHNEKFRSIFENILDKVIIDEIDMSNGLYSAHAIFRSDDLTFSVKMIPSHAIYLALVLEKPIYVAEELVRLEEEAEEFSDDEDEEEEEE